MMVITENLKFRFGPTSTTMVYPDIQGNRDQQICVLGRSGTGKSTLLHLLAGFLKPQEGKIYIDGQDMGDMSESARDQFRAQRIGFIFQQNLFVPSITVEDNLLLSQKLGGYSPDRKKVEDLLDRLSIADKAPKKPSELSIGEQQRVSIARAVVNEPGLILADEPTSALDDDNCHLVLELLTTSAREHHACLMVVTHDQRVRSHFETQYHLI